MGSSDWVWSFPSLLVTFLDYDCSQSFVSRVSSLNTPPPLDSLDSLYLLVVFWKPVPSFYPYPRLLDLG